MTTYLEDLVDRDNLLRHVLEALADSGFGEDAEIPHVLYMSGRSEACREATLEWLHNRLPWGLDRDKDDDGMPPRLFMRAADDTRSDEIVKAELFDRHVRGKYDVAAVFDDRDHVVKMWRAMGLQVFQVAEGAF